MQPDIAAFKQAEWERNFQLAAAVIVGYEYVLQFGDEVEYFWKKRWTIPQVLFLWARYYSVPFNIANTVVFMQKHPALDLFAIGTKFFHWQNTGASLQIITTHLVLELRLYAMYGSSKKILALFICTTICEAAVMGIIFGLPVPGLVGTNNPSPGLLLCADADPSHGHHWIAYVPTLMLVVEFMLLFLALYKAWKHRRPAGGELMKFLTTQSLGYFVAIVWCHITTQVIWMMNRITLNELPTGIGFVIPSVLANRLLISLRSKNDDANFHMSTLTPNIHFRKSFFSFDPQSREGDNTELSVMDTDYR